MEKLAKSELACLEGLLTLRLVGLNPDLDFTQVAEASE